MKWRCRAPAIIAEPTVQVAGDRDAEVDAAVARYAAHVRAGAEPAA
ncbi:hypothetical protein HFO42_17675 [Rhizobium leguminosarum]|uniref:Uncharacterized protein n=1 Tax=Rhizobium leguminosarum TaxID=384 RepID=A0AAJ1EFB9_RHILE|nr:hypothetical protein [Rhizobium leguminosarum]MBY5535518.1 hypothetical protein [Rhizobium leguminosarum]MBY5596622.1 hypothetical protein [Rhizobium leguminosarum]MBY5616017.1 hypothetical protein [Rhizobium leguminosarum]MBY5629917.1 hypothetical protein [Rhizobium leguminosarum]MBY5731047.1 hypothetical protein [Rhizobium leguminosarum]